MQLPAVGVEAGQRMVAKMKKAGEESPAFETQFSTAVTMNEYLAFVKQKMLDKKPEKDSPAA